MDFWGTFWATMWGALAGAGFGAVLAWLFSLELRKRERQDRAADLEQTRLDREAERRDAQRVREAERLEAQRVRDAERAADRAERLRSAWAALAGVVARFDVNDPDAIWSVVTEHMTIAALADPADMRLLWAVRQASMPSKLAHPGAVPLVASVIMERIETDHPTARLIERLEVGMTALEAGQEVPPAPTP